MEMESRISIKAYRIVVVALLLFAVSLRAYSERAVKPTIRERVVAVADSQVGVREATGSNDGKEVKKYLKVTGLPEGNPWCAAYVSWVFEQVTPAGPRSARVVDWFKSNVCWLSGWGEMPYHSQPGMVGALYYQKLGRYGHIVLIVGEDKNNFYTIEGNTNIAGSREGDGVYRKVRSKESIAAIADYLVTPKEWIETYEKHLK
jgi:hypothetical protein